MSASLLGESVILPSVKVEKITSQLIIRKIKSLLCLRKWLGLMTQLYTKCTYSISIRGAFTNNVIILLKAIDTGNITVITCFLKSLLLFKLLLSLILLCLLIKTLHCIVQQCTIKQPKTKEICPIYQWHR